LNFKVTTTKGQANALVELKTVINPEIVFLINKYWIFCYNETLVITTKNWNPVLNLTY